MWSWYRGVISNRQMVMIGYSGFGKDAGMMKQLLGRNTVRKKPSKLIEKLGIEFPLYSRTWVAPLVVAVRQHGITSLNRLVP